MNILNYSLFNENVKLRVLDFVIDSKGNVYNGLFNTLVKGNVDYQKSKGVSKKLVVSGILGSDGNYYIAGIDKNGNLITQDKNINEDGILIDDSGKVVEMDPEVSTKLGIDKWLVDFKYSSLLSINPTGWVNFKVDMEILKRVRRYSVGLGSVRRGHKSLLSKLEDLDSINYIKNRKRSMKTIQREMATIMLLHYLEEIKNFFTPSQSGFLVESFIAGLLPNGEVVDDNGAADVISDGKEYQIKCINDTSGNLEFVRKQTTGGLRYLDYYVICIKYINRIDIYIFDGDENSPNYCGKTHPAVDDKGKMKSTKTRVVNSGIKPYSINLIEIENNIDKISKGLKSVLDGLYSELSEFHYNVETIVSGVNKHGKLIDVDEFESYSNLAKKNAQVMRDELDNLITHYKGGIK
jgi:hypothetical protein